jgi:hypothetical protein
MNSILPKIMAGKKFCMAPWTHMHFMPNRDVNLCCMSPIDKVIGNMNNQTIKEVWNSTEMRDVRTRMMNDEDCSEYCHRCYEKEEQGYGSLRQHMNQTYGPNHIDKVESTAPDGTFEDLNLVHWDFRFSNICNQSCRSCGIEFSTQWHKDHIKLYEISKENAPPKYKKIWDSVDAFEKDFETLFDKVEYIHFAGGEPLITDEHYRVLQKLIDLGKTDITIRYSTNFGELRYKDHDVIDYWKHFKNIQVIASLDDCGDRYNYIRKGGDWDLVVDNFKRLRENGLFKNRNIMWGIHPTISIFNIFYLVDFHRECMRLRMVDSWTLQHKEDDDWYEPVENHWTSVFHLNYLTQPYYYNANILPAHMKQMVTEKINNYADELQAKYNMNVDHLRSIVISMNSEDNSHHLPKFIEMTNKLDSIRKEDVKKTFPFLEELFRD